MTTTTISRKRTSSLCILLVTLLIYRDRLHKACNSTTTILLGTVTTKPSVLSEEEEVKAMILADDLVITERVPCGKEKCFFPSKLHSQQGYLVARSGRNVTTTDSKYDRLVEGWKLATRLEHDYNIQHFLQSPPEIIAVSDHLASLINQHLWYETLDLPVNKVATNKKRNRFPVHSQVYVQKVQAAPTPNLLLACAHSNRPHFERHVETFLMNATQNKFARNFFKNLAQTRKLLQQEPCLMKDFQVVLDSHGNIYHLDFDRCFHTRETDETKPCLDYLHKVEMRIHNTLQDPFQPDNLVVSKQVPCGKEKCFYRVQSNKDVAFLVARFSEKPNRKGRFASLQAGWELAEQLSRDYNIQHFLLAPPANVTVT